MASEQGLCRDELSTDDAALVQEILGYLNFSNGKPDAGFQQKLNRLHAKLPSESAWSALRRLLRDQLVRLKSAAPVFADSDQAAAVIELTLDGVWPAYRAHHADLLFHLTDADLQQPFLAVRMFEAVLAQGPPWQDRERIIAGAIGVLNDFVGFRPVAVLENGRKMQPYDHERFRPIPLYLRDVGVTSGKYRDLIACTIEFLKQTPQETLRCVHLHLEQLDELALDVRAHDHEHPVNKRTNYTFGEWDPHLIDTTGRYRRFVLRKIILDAMLDWMDSCPGVPRDELLFDASAVLSGTMMMASAISGSGPDTHDSNVTLTSLLPTVARKRDDFYAWLLQATTGPRAKRLAKESKRSQQPFGHVRQYLNLHLARYGAQQIQHRHLAQLYARMGYADASREEAAVIPSAAARFGCELQWRITAAHRRLERADVAQAVVLIHEAEDLLHRGVECGAIVDPWNILGFQGQFPLFASREDSIPDQRVEELLEIVERLFGVYARAISEAAAQGDTSALERLVTRFEALAGYWDQFASHVIEDLPKVMGHESCESAKHVAVALAEWRAAGEAAGDISFWRTHVERFESAKAFALVVEELLEKRDYVAAMGLLMQWLSQADKVGLEAGPHSIHALLLKWMQHVTGHDGGDEHSAPWLMIRRLFDYLEANAGEFWTVPSLDDATGEVAVRGENGWSTNGDAALDDGFFDEEDDEEDLFGAAYDGMVFSDSALDGNDSELMDSGFRMEDSEFEIIGRQLDPRLRFLMTLAQLWQSAASSLLVELAPADGREPAENPSMRDDRREVVAGWRCRARQLQSDLLRLLSSAWDLEIPVPSGDHDSNVEYDMHLQTKFYLVHTVIQTYLQCRMAERSLLCCLSSDAVDKLSKEETTVIRVYRALLTGDIEEVRLRLPDAIKQLARRPLLYVPLDNGGHPRQVLEARSTQADIRFLLTQLPRLGLLRETWFLVKTAYRMERQFRPDGMMVTEFDRVFRTALRGSLESVVRSFAAWKQERELAADGAGACDVVQEKELIHAFQEIVQHYCEQWEKHSRTMRLSSVEGMQQQMIWDEVKDFIADYGADLFHAKMLTLGNVRSILHHGIEWFLEYLAETADPLQPMRLLEDLDDGKLQLEHAVDVLELIYGSLVDKFDRFLEYNTTTTQSDYGEMFHYLLEFLRVEAAYDRDAWNFMPLGLAHEVLSENDKSEMLETWELFCDSKFRERADRHLAKLQGLEKTFGIRLPSIDDRLNERFIKPLAVNRMVDLVPLAMRDSRDGHGTSESFSNLRAEIRAYMQDSFGSGIDVPEWLQDLEKEVFRIDSSGPGPRVRSDFSIKAPPVPLSLKDLKQQLKSWNQSIMTSTSTRRRPPGRNRRKKSD